MAKRRKPGGNSTLTKIDPALLRQKPPAVSQHADDSGAPVTTTINPTPFSAIPPEEPVFFGTDVPNFGDGYPEGDVTEGEAAEGDITEEEIVEWYPTTSVSPCSSSSTGGDSLSLGQSAPGLEKGSTTLPRRAHSFRGPRVFGVPRGCPCW